MVPFRSPLLRKSLLLSFPRGTEMFQFPRFPPLGLCVQPRVTGHDPCRVSPFGHPRIEAWSAAPRGLSQPPTSFFGIWRQGIHRWLFVAWNSSRCSCSLCSSQGALEPFVSLTAPEQQPARRPAGGSTRRTGQEDLVPSKRNSGVRLASRLSLSPGTDTPGRFTNDVPTSQ